MLHAVALWLCSATVSAAPVDADLIIQGATLYDGRGGEGVKGDLAIKGEPNRPPTGEELEKMKALVEKGMKEGAWGLATGLYYTPGSYADTDELVELSKVVAKHGGFYASHMRNEGTGLLASVTETLTIGKRAGLPVHISHMQAF